MAGETQSAVISAIGLIDNIVGEAKSLGHDRKPAECMDFSVNVLTVLKKNGITTVDDAIALLSATKSLVERATGDR